MDTVSVEGDRSQGLPEITEARYKRASARLKCSLKRGINGVAVLHCTHTVLVKGLRRRKSTLGEFRRSQNWFGGLDGTLDKLGNIDFVNTYDK